MIDKFENENEFLSNFYPAEVTFGGLKFKTLEHAFVAAKTTLMPMRFEISAIETPEEVKKFGKGLQLRPDWEEVKVGIMYGLVNTKFHEPKLRELLLATGEEELVEGNTWHDNFWGSCVCKKCGNKGQNQLGKTLMKVRRELQPNSVDFLPKT